MKILLINKFLYPRGGSETYVRLLGQALTAQGHEVQYFGMDHPDRFGGNRAESYAPDMDFHGGSILGKWSYPLKILYSRPARRAMRRVLEDFQPDVCHLNNFHYQLTPSILLEIRAWSERRGRPCKIISTAHDYQLVCPNHLCRNPVTGTLCEKCLNGSFWNCVRHRCIHGSLAKSMAGAMEAAFWNHTRVYETLDAIVCCSRFLKSKLDTNPVLAQKTIVLPNFVEAFPRLEGQREPYVFYFGRYSEEKGLHLLLEAAKALPQIPFVFAGTGPLATELANIPNVRDLGFQTGEVLRDRIRRARFTLCPSVWYENCPMSILESLRLGTPVLGADIGGIPELIRPGKTGLLFTPGSREDLIRGILQLWEQPLTMEETPWLLTPEDYVRLLLDLAVREEVS